MNRVTSNFLPAIAALVALLVAGWSQAAVITMTYVNGQVSTTSNFTTATTTTVNLANPVSVSGGQFFRFGVALSVSSNANPEFGTPYASDANTVYGVTYPANLGFSSVGMVVNSTDANGLNVAPLNNSGKTRVAINSAGGLWTGSTNDAGDINASSPGVAGSPSSIFRGLGPFAPDSASAVTGLGTLAQPGANFINSLPYSIAVGATDGAILTPTIKLTDTTIWSRTVAGDGDGSGNISTDASFLNRPLNIGGGDSIVAPTPIVLVVPEPASIGLVGLSLVGLLARRRVA